MTLSPLAFSDPLQLRREARRRVQRVALPLLGVALVVAAVLGIALFVHRANRAGVLGLADDMLLQLERRVSQEVVSFLDPVAQATRLAAEVAADGPLDAADAPALEGFALAILEQVPQVTLFSLADTAGNYLQVRRGEQGLDSKRIRNAPPPRSSRWTRRGADGAVLRTEEEPEDSFDPRTRSWYGDALAAQGLSWTEPYVFFSDRTPGITASIAIRGPDGQARGVVGLDIALAELSRFLASLKVGRTGQALVLDAAGRLVAARDPALVLKQDGDALAAVRPDALGEAVVTRAWDMARLDPTLHGSFELNGRRHIVAASPLSAQGAEGWSLLLTAPEADFTGFVGRNSRAALLMSLAVVALTLLLAAFLVRQGLRADRAVRRMLDQGRALAAQSAAFARLGASAGMFDRGGTLPPAVLEELAAVTGARRASLWRLSADGRSLACEDAWDAQAGAHVSGAELHASELPRLFAALAEGQPVAVPDAAADPRTVDLHRLWLHPLGSTALVAVPVRAGDRLLGTLWIEDAAPAAIGAADFAAAVANMVALRLAERPGEALPATPHDLPATASNDARPAPRRDIPPVARRADAAARPATAPRGLDEAALAGLPRHDLAADVFPEVAVLVLRLTDLLALGHRPGAEAAPRLGHLAAALQEVAAAHDLPYLKLLGEQVVAAAGFAGPEDEAALERVAAAALAIRSRCAALFEDDGSAPEFRLGLDCGIAIGTSVGAGQRVFNLWGEAVRGADELAATALPGSIQASESVYARLRQGFLLRPRGAFWMPRQGERRTYVLAGQL